MFDNICQNVQSIIISMQTHGSQSCLAQVSCTMTHLLTMTLTSCDTVMDDTNIVAQGIELSVTLC